MEERKGGAAEGVPDAVGMGGSAAELSSDKGIRIIGIIAILAGVVSILAIIGDSGAPTPTTSSLIAQQLATFNANQTAYAFSLGADAVGYTLAIAFAGGLSSIVRRKSPSVATAAALLVTAGALAALIDKSLFVGPLFAIASAPGTAANAPSAAYLASVVAGLFLDWIFVAFLLIGVGAVLFGWLMWEGEIFPKWLSRVVLVLGILYFVPPITYLLPSALSILAPISLLGADVLGLVWFFETGIVLFRSKSTVAEPAK